MADETMQEVRERLIRIEVLLEQNNKNTDLKFEAVREEVKVANKRIADLENSNTWLYRLVIGALITGSVGLLFTFVK